LLNLFQTIHDQTLLRAMWDLRIFVYYVSANNSDFPTVTFLILVL